MDVTEMTAVNLLNMAGAWSMDQKKAFLKAFLNICSTEEVHYCRNILQRAERRAHPSKTSALKWEMRKKSRLQENEAAASNVVQTPEIVQPSSDAVRKPIGTDLPLGWYSQHFEDEVVGIDCEMVSILNTDSPSSSKYKQVAATVGICNFQGEEIYRATVKHEDETFLVTPATVKVNGILSHSLKDGKEFSKIKEEVHSILQGKLVVGHALNSDISCLDLIMGNYNTFDNQWELWRELNGQKLNFKLKALMNEFFKNKDFQAGSHSAMEDAIASVAIFRDIYLQGAKKSDFFSKSNPSPSNFIDPLKEEKERPQRIPGVKYIYTL